ncbi:MAG: hypothetical protein JWQ99_3823 [Blastococcus sp.]|jgi:hypothetical protein|nr:hypothetical protein [Blastococcus sp.]
MGCVALTLQSMAAVTDIGEDGMATDVLLMRHVAGWKSSHSGVGDESRSAEYPELLSKGVQAACAVAERLRETLDEQSPPAKIRIGPVWHGTRPEPTATAKILSTYAHLDAPQPMDFLDPSNFRPGGGPEAARALNETVERIRSQPPTGSAGALLIIGHEPQVGWLAHCMTKSPVPIDRGELVCLVPSRRHKDQWRVAWTIHPDDSSAVTDLREKIKSKMDAAKVMGAFITALVTFVLTAFLQGSRDIGTATWVLRALTVLLLLAAAGLFFVSLFHYDSLLMPPRFWGSSMPKDSDKQPETSNRRSRDWLVRRPPSSSAWILYQNMVRIWNRTFVPAVWLVGGGLITFCQAVLKPDRLVEWWVLPAGAVGALLVLVWTRESRPQLGAQD